MEWALQVTHHTDLAWLEHIYEFKLNRLYFGHEFCEHRIPDREAVQMAYTAAGERGLEFTLVTPYVTDRGLDALLPLFRFLTGLTVGVEVVVNDWGVLNMLSRDFPQLRPVLGRLLNKMIRDPRVAGVGKSTAGNSSAGNSTSVESANVFRRSGVTVGVYRSFLRSMGVERVELDNLIQGIDLDFCQLELEGSLYYPYACITTGRACLVGSLGLPAEEKFKPQPGCGRQCREYTAAMTAPGLEPEDYTIFHKGNTVFYHQGESLIRQGLDTARKCGIGRLVYQPRPPM